MLALSLGNSQKVGQIPQRFKVSIPSIYLVILDEYVLKSSCKKLIFPCAWRSAGIIKKGNYVSQPDDVNILMEGDV